MTESRQGRPAFTGLLLTARRDALQAIANRGAGDILAIERLTGTARPFAITIDPYRPPAR